MENWDRETPETLKLTFLRDILQASRDPEAERFPLLELASTIIRSPMSPTELLERFGRFQQ